MHLFLDAPSEGEGMPPAFLFLIVLSHPLTRVGSTRLLYRLTLTSELSRAPAGFRQARALFEPMWKAWRHRPLLLWAGSALTGSAALIRS